MSGYVRRCLGAVVACMIVMSALVASTLVGGATSHAAEAVTVKVIATPATSTAIMQLGVDKGIYQRNGINLVLDGKASPPQVVPSVVSGQSDLGASNTSAFNTVIANGLPLKIVAPVVNSGNTNANDDVQWITPANSGVKSFKDLKGKTVAVPLLRGSAELSIRVAALHNGIGQRDFKLAQLNFPEMEAAMRAGRVQVASLLEPFLAQALSRGKWRLLGGVQATITHQKVPGLALFARSDWVAKNQATLVKLRKAQSEAIKYAVSHRAEWRRVVVEKVGIPAALANKIRMGNPSTVFNVKGLQRLADLQFKFNLLPKHLNSASYVVLK